VFTGLLLADLAHEGIVGLDAPLASYLPAWVRVPTRGGRQITLGDLASHAAGLPRNPSGTLRRWRGDRSMSCTPALPGPGCGPTGRARQVLQPGRRPAGPGAGRRERAALRDPGPRAHLPAAGDG
jgi:CubicO group peptidase (beta-lactamase class C family)